MAVGNSSSIISRMMEAPSQQAWSSQTQHETPLHSGTERGQGGESQRAAGQEPFFAGTLHVPVAKCTQADLLDCELLKQTFHALGSATLPASQGV